jgi:endonuclease I
MFKKLSLVVLLAVSTVGYSQIPSYYNDVNLNLTGTALRDELATKVISTHTTTLSYGWTVIQQTDLDPSNNANVLLIYGSNDSDGNYVTDRTRSVNSNGGSGGSDWNREHTYPKSLGTPNLGTSGPGADVHHLRASDVTMNNDRGSLKFATGSGVAGTSGSGWYPGDEWKGDVARMMMYMYIRYDSRCYPTNVATGTTNSVDANMIDLLLDWNAEDPVSQYETNRNNILETEQGNRNPFIDNPAFATEIWGGTQAEDLFSGASVDKEINLQGNTVSIADGSTTTSTTNNTDFGSVDSTSGTIIKTFTIQNTGGTTLTLSGNPTISTGDASDFTVSSNPGSLSLAAGVSTTFQITFDPSVDGIRATTVTIESDDADEGTYTYNISGTGTTGGSGGGSGSNCGSETFANSNVSSGGYSDGSFTGDNSLTWTYVEARDDEGYEITGTGLMLRNTSSKVTSGTVSGGIGDFTMSLKKGFTGSGNRQVSLYVNNVLEGTSISWDNTITQTFAVTGIDVAGDVVIEIRNATGSQVILDDISWTCYSGASAQEINIEGNAVSIPNGSTTTSTTNDTDFGSADTSSGTLVKTFTIQNLGGSNLTLSENPTFSTGEASDFTVTSNPSLTIAGAGTTSFDITFNPSADGERTTTVTVSSDDSDEATYTFNISGTGTSVGASCGPELFISEYIEGSSNNKFLEIYNPTGASIDLSSYDIVTYVNGSATVSNTLTLSGTIASESTFVIENSSENLSVTSDLSTSNTVMQFNGNDVVALRKASTIIDIIGQIGVDPGSTWAGTCSSESNTLIRNTAITEGDTDGSDAFTTDTEWSCTSVDDVTNLGTHTITCSSDPEIDIQGNAISIASGSTSTTAANNTFLGEADITSGSQTKSFTILNTGSSTLTLSGIPAISGTDSSDFTISSSPTLSISSSSSTTFNVTFDPSTVGTKVATITVSNDDADEATYTFSISGTGTTGAVACASASGATLFQQDFESSAATPELTYTSTNTSISSGNGNTPSDPMYSGGVNGLEASNTTATIEFATFDSTSYSNLNFSVRLASFSVTSGNGAETTDYAKVFVSTDNGSSYSDELTVTGASAANARWSFVSGTGEAVATYDGDNSTTTFASSGGDARTTDGYSTLTISSLPSSLTLKIKIELRNNNANEIWVIDDAKITGDSESITTWSGTWSSSAPTDSVKMVLESDYDMTTEPSIETCECEVKPGNTLTISADKFLKVENNIINNGTIIVEDSGNVLQVSDLSSISGSGTYSVKRNTTSLASRHVFTYWSSPLASSTLNEIAPDAHLYYSFNSGTQSWVSANAATSMTPGLSYAVEGPNAGHSYPGSYTAEFSGSEFNNGDVDVALSFSDDFDADNDWNLIGNPYPSAIDASILLSSNSSLGGTIYFWTHNTDASTTQTFTQDDYVSWNQSGGTASCAGCIAPTGNIASGQGFFTQALSASTISFTNNMRIGENNDNFYRTSSTEEDDKIWLNLSSDNSFNQILVGFFDEATDGIDRLYDGATLDGGTNASFYSLINNVPFVIQGKNQLAELEIIPLGFRTNTLGEFTISINHLHGNLNSSLVTLQDNLLNISHNLKDSDYVFTITETGVFNSRFKLVISNSILNTDEIDYKSKLVIQNSLNGLIIKTADGSLIKKVLVYNILGKEVINKEGSSSSIELKSPSIKSNSILIIKTLLENGEMHIDKILKK